MTSRNTCNLIFSTSLDKTRTVRIPEPSAALTVPTIQLAASRFVTANPFDETIGSLVALVKAERVTVNRTVLI